MFTRDKHKSRKVTTSFVRNLRKGYLLPSGAAKPGQERVALRLLWVLKFLQEGDYDNATFHAKQEGFDLQTLYNDYLHTLKGCDGSKAAFRAAVAQFCERNKVHMGQEREAM